MTSTAYPRRKPYFSQRFLRLMVKTCVAQNLGQDAFTLLATISATEDAKRYTGAVTFHNEQLMPILGIRKWERLNAARKDCQAAGWLEYIAPRRGSKEVPQYWVRIPDEFAGLDDSPVDESGDLLKVAYERGYVDGQAGRPKEPYPKNGYASPKASPKNGYALGDAPGYAMGALSYPGPDPIPKSTRTSSAADLERGTKENAKQPAFTPEDLEVATWFAGKIKALDPERKPPKLETWARDVRLMREIDDRTHQHIRELLERVQQDNFWRLQVLCPGKLREKWDDLRLKLGVATAPATNGSAYAIRRSRTPESELPRIPAGRAGA